jgi:hypothetical protein
MGTRSSSRLISTVASLGSTSNEVFRGVAAAPLPAVASVVVNGSTDAFPIVSATESGTTVTFTTQAAPDFAVGKQVLITGVGVPGYNGTFTLTSVSGSTFTYTAASSGLGASSGGAATGVSWAIATATESATTVTITTTAANGLHVGEHITIAGNSVGGYNGTFVVTGVSGTMFTYTDANTGLAGGSGGNAQVGFTIAVHLGQFGTLPALNFSSSDGGLTWLLTFAGASVIGNSMADGGYDITLNQSAVTYNYSGATLTQSNRATDTFFRLYGDSNGDQIVNARDYFQFKNAFGTSSGQSGYLAYFDYNDDGIINAADNFQLKKRFGVGLSGFTPTI